MRKKIKMLVSMLAAAAMLVLLPDGSAMTAKAEASTYSLKYIGGTVNDWRFMPGSTFEDNVAHRETYYLTTQDLKDGDHIVIYAGDTVPNKELDLSGFKLGSLTVYQNATVTIHTNGIKDCYVLAGASAAINGEVTNAQLYDNVTCNFNNSVLDMVLHISGDPQSNIACAGTVGMFQVLKDPDDSKALLYNIPNNTMRYVNGTIQFPIWDASPTEAYLQAKNAASGTAAAPEATPAPAAPAPADPAPAGSASSEYDKVPKTGEDSQTGLLIGLVGAAAVLFAASYGLYKKAE